VALAPITSDTRGYAAGKFGLEMDGVMVGWLISVEGGHGRAEVVSEAVGADYFVKKHIGQPKYEDITLEMGATMSKPVYDWIASSMTANHQRKNGAIIFADYNYKQISRLEFFNALITEVSFPTLDAASKDVAKLTLKLTPESTRRVVAGKGAAVKGTVDAKAQKLWTTANFRLNIDGLDTSKVSKVEALTIKQTVVTDSIGDARDYMAEPGKLEFPNLTFTVADNASGPFYDWFQDFVINGNADESKEKGGTIEFLSPNLKEVIFKLTLKNIGIFEMAAPKSEANVDKAAQVEVSTYLERIELTTSPNTK
jgi:phage tail-like protein